MMQAVDDVLKKLRQSVDERGERRPMPFKSFLARSAQAPERVFRDIFHLFSDMIHSYVGDGKDEYPDDPESINYVFYDCTRLFVDGSDHPFFADRLFANRLVNLAASFKRGVPQNRIYVFEGPHGCGKSTFLNNLLMRFEQYTASEEGATYETIWRLDKNALGVIMEHEAHAVLAQLKNLVNVSAFDATTLHKEAPVNFTKKDFLEIPCPSHDHPWLLIPKSNRRELLDQLIDDEAFKEKLFAEKQYEWLFRDKPCTICTSLYQTLQDMLASPSKVFEMVFARRYIFNRRLGEGISVYNPGDKIPKTTVMTNPLLQNQLNSLLKDSNRVKYLFSRYAKTNNGIYALMDIKDHNMERFADLHGIISEGVHKVEDIEENVTSLFLTVMNPEDQENIAGTQSFFDRMTYIKIPYVLDYNTEVKIYKSIFGDKIECSFLPRVLQNFAKIILSSRLMAKSDGLNDWISQPDKYKRYCDQQLLLLKMDIYAGIIPAWLDEKDRKNFNAKCRRSIIAESELEGNKGFSGRDSIKIFNDFFSAYAQKEKPITMAKLVHFFREIRTDLNVSLPSGFLDALVSSYDYTVLQEVKEALYFYNEERIARDIKNYLFGINFEPTVEKKCIYTDEDLVISEDFFQSFERRVLGSAPDDAKLHAFRTDIQSQYASKALTGEMMVEGKQIEETEVYQFLHERYVHNLKAQVLDPFVENTNFRNALKDYGSDAFKTYDKRIREEVTFLMKNLKQKYGYTEQGAQEVVIYVVDNDLVQKFA